MLLTSNTEIRSPSQAAAVHHVLIYLPQPQPQPQPLPLREGVGGETL
jgi:hypothetical protein